MFEPQLFQADSIAKHIGFNVVGHGLIDPYTLLAAAVLLLISALVGRLSMLSIAFRCSCCKATARAEENPLPCVYLTKPDLWLHSIVRVEVGQPVMSLVAIHEKVRIQDVLFAVVADDFPL